MKALKPHILTVAALTVGLVAGYLIGWRGPDPPTAPDANATDCTVVIGYDPSQNRPVWAVHGYNPETGKHVSYRYRDAARAQAVRDAVLDLLFDEVRRATIPSDGEQAK